MGVDIVVRHSVLQLFKTFEVLVKHRVWRELKDGARHQIYAALLLNRPSQFHCIWGPGFVIDASASPLANEGRVK
jgi:hypothetical protein